MTCGDPNFSPRLRDKIWEWPSWGRGYIILAITHVAFVNQSTEERTLKILLENKSVKVWGNLYDDSIGEEGTRSLVDALIHNTTHFASLVID